MKKLLLTAAIAVMAMAQAWAVTDGQTYAEYDGIKIANQWIFDRVHTTKDYMANPICNTRARTAVLNGDVIYVARSEEKAVIVGNDTVSQSIIHRFSVKDGSALPDLELTLDGAPYSRFLGVASIGKDNFGHIWVAPMTSNLQVLVPIYIVDTETGELTLAGNLEKGEALARTDYLDLVGDITLKEAKCTIMTVGGSGSDPGVPSVYCWTQDQGELDPEGWEGGFEGDVFVDFTEYYPETCTGFSLAPVIKIVLGEDEETLYDADLFYIDCFGRDPVLYTKDGSLIDTFEEADASVKQTDKNANGVLEFSVDGRKFLAYPKAQYDKNGNGCQAYVTEFTDEEMSLGGLAMRWQLPADSLGKVSDTGLRIHCLSYEKEVDAEGNEVVTLFTFKAYNGMAVYKIGKNVQGGDPEPPALAGDVNNDGVVDVTDANILINIILGKDDAANYGGRADIDGNNVVDISDLNKVLNIMLGK